MRRSRFTTYLTATLVLVLAATGQAHPTDWQDAFKRCLPEMHRTYLIGLYQGINDAGGMRPSDWAIVNDMQQRWDSTYDLLAGNCRNAR